MNLRNSVKFLCAALCVMITFSPAARAQEPAAGEASLKLPDLSTVSFLGMNGHNLLLIGLVFCVAGLLFGLVIYMQLKNMPVHIAMRDVSELIYETCKTYLITQGKFLAILWAFIAVIIVFYFAVLLHYAAGPVAIILGFSILGILGSYGVAHALTTRGSLVRIPRTVLERRRRVTTARDALTAAGHAPSVSELAALTSLSPAAVAEAMAPTSIASLDQPLPDGTLLGERLAGDDEAQPAALVLAEHEKRAVRVALQRLRPRKQAILRRHYGIDAAPESLNKIAAALHLSPERTRALKEEALREIAGELTAAGV